MGFTPDALSEMSGLSIRTLARIHAGYAPARLAVTCLMMPLAYGADVRDALLDGPLDPDALDALAAPTDAISRVEIIPPAYRGRSIFIRRVGRGLPPLVRPGSFVACATGPVEDRSLALVEMNRGQAVRYVSRVGDNWQLSETPEGRGWVELAARRVKRVSTLLYEFRGVALILAGVVACG